MYIKGLKRKKKNKKYFYKTCLQCFSSENVFMRHKEDFLSINVARSTKLEKETTEFENFFKQIPAPFKIYADFEFYLKVLKSMKVFTRKSIKITFLVIFLTKLFVLTIDLVSQLLLLEVKKLLMNLLKQFLRSMNIAKK